MKEQIIEEAATALLWKKYPYHPPKDYGYWKDMFKEGAKWNEEIMIDFANWCRIHDKKFPNEVWTIQQLHTKYFAETYGSKGSDECCTPKGQIKRYVDCIGCDKKASSQTTSDKWKEYQNWLNEVPEDVEKLAETEYPIFDGDLLGITHNQQHRRFGFIAGYNKAKATSSQTEKMYSEEEVRTMLSESFKASQEGYNITSDEIIKQFKKK